jgi:hypothetical protein
MLIQPLSARLTISTARFNRCRNVPWFVIIYYVYATYWIDKTRMKFG